MMNGYAYLVYLIDSRLSWPLSCRHHEIIPSLMSLGRFSALSAWVTVQEHDEQLDSPETPLQEYSLQGEQTVEETMQSVADKAGISARDKMTRLIGLELDGRPRCSPLHCKTICNRGVAKVGTRSGIKIAGKERMQSTAATHGLAGIKWFAGGSGDSTNAW